MTNWMMNRVRTDGDLDDEFTLYESNDVNKEKALRFTTEGKLIARSIEDAKGGSTVPVGGILMWSGNVSDIPEGWVLCDGRNGTPDLVARFIRGASATAEPKAHTKGGNDTHSHAASAQVTLQRAGSHTHVMPEGWYDRNISNTSGPVTIIDRSTQDVSKSVTRPEGEHTHGATASVSIQEENSLPKWYALCFIMKK